MFDTKQVKREREYYSVMDTESTATLLEIYDSCVLRIGNHEFPEGSAERKQFAVSVCGNNNNLFIKLSPWEYTAFHLAVDSDSTEMLEALIEAARRLPSSSSSSSSSSTNDDPQTTTLQTLLRRADCKGNTALHRAVIANKLEHAKLLAEADPNDRHMQRESSPPLCTAACLGYLNIVKMIAETCTAPAVYGALLAVIPQLPEGYSESSDHIVESIIEAGRRYYYSTDPTDHRFVDFIQQADSKSKNTALHLAVMGSHLGIVKQILMANPSYRCEYDNNRELKTPIYIAAERGYKDIVRELCKHAGSSLAYMEGPKKQTVLHAAVLGRDKACVEMVLNSFRVERGQDEDGWTPLHHAAYSKFDSVIDIIGKRFQDEGPYAMNLASVLYKKGAPSPLWMAIEQGHTSTTVEIIKVLPDLCLKVDPESRQNILHLAAEKNDKQTVQAILKTCPPEYIRKILNGRDINKNTPLHLLIANGCFVKQLIEHDQMDKTARNYQNWTPFDMLYVQEDIVADQLAIKTLIDEANQDSSFWRRSSSNMDTQESLVPPRKRSEKDVKFKIANETMMKAKILRYRERTNTQIIVTALITTVTFTVGFTMPGGYYQTGELDKKGVLKQGSVLLAKETAFKAFIVSDAIALALSTTSLFLYFISTMYEDPRQVSKLNATSTGLNIFSIVAMMVTFISGIYAVLSHSPALALAICLICSAFFVCIVLLLILLIKLGYDRNKLKDSLA